MIFITPEDGPEGLSDSIQSLERQLADMRAGLDAIYEQIKDGDFDEIKTATKATTEIRQWLKLALEAEVQLEKRNKSKQGIAHDFAINFAEARIAVCSRLDNLRKAGNAESVSGESE